MKTIQKQLLLLILCICMAGSTASAKGLVPRTEVSDYTFKEGMGLRQINARKAILKAAKSYLNIKEKSTKHKRIVKLYNSIPVNFYRPGQGTHFTATTSMAWCDIFVTAIFAQAGYSERIGAECGCEAHINLLKKKKRWIENDAYIPSTGDLIFYDWNDNGKGDNRGWADHVGIVVSTANSKVITTIEGNYDDTVKYRVLRVNSRYIRGYGIPW